MSESGRFLLASLCGLFLAAAVHIVAVLAMPTFALHDAFSRLRGTMTAENAQLVAGPGGAETWLADHDPSTAVAACAYDLAQGPVRVATKVGALPQSLSFHARGAGVFFAVTDRAAVRGDLEIVVLTRRQLDETLAAEDEEDPSQDVRIVAPRTEGLVVVRVIAPSPSLRPEAENAAKAVSCTIETDEE